MEEEYKSNFDDNGVHNACNSTDKKLFEQIKSIVHEKVSVGGHTYVPESLEFRASSIAYCRRKILLNKDPENYLNDDELQLIKREEKDEIPSTFGTSVVGQLIHETFQNALEDELKDKIKIEDEISLKIGKATLKGHFDLLMKDENGEEIVIDIKTTTTRKHFLPKLGHMRQLMAYQGILGGIRGAILYVHRNNWELNYVPQEFNKEEFSKLVIKVTELAGFETRKELPPVQPALPDECGNDYWKCDYHKLCYPEFYESLDDFEVVQD